MSGSIDHLDFYPHSPESIAALHSMQVMDMPQKEIELHSVNLEREKSYAAILETSVAMCGASVGYLGYEQATQHNQSARHNQSGSSERLPEITIGILAVFSIVATLTAGVTRAWGAKTWEQIKTATSRN